MTEIRHRLAVRLGLYAFVALCIALVAGAASLALAIWSLSAVWAAVAGGAVASALLHSAAFLVGAAGSSFVFAWVCAPPAPPGGVLLPRQSAPSLYALIDRILQRMGGNPIDAVWIVADMNAAVLQRPRWGCFGPMETHLMIGLPLAHSVSRRQLAAILAHEFAHVVAQRSGVAGWGAHLRAWWLRAQDRISDDVPWLDRLCGRFNVRFLHAALRLSRLEEFEADAIAARLVGSRLLGEALVEVALKERFLCEDYWQKVMAQSKVKARPSIRPYRDMGLGMAAGFLRPEPAAAHMRSLFADGGAGGMPFHPSLADRLRALRVEPGVPAGDDLSAAEHYLSPLLPSLAWVFDHAWWNEARRPWRTRYRRARNKDSR